MKVLPLMHIFYALAPENEVVLRLPSGISESVKIKALKRQDRFALISFDNINTPETALKYRGALISAERSLLPALCPDEYYHDQIIGLSVHSIAGNNIGRITDIFPTGSNDVYVVKGADREYLIPAIRDVIKKINLEEGTITIQIVDGLLD